MKTSPLNSDQTGQRLSTALITCWAGKQVVGRKVCLRHGWAGTDISSSSLQFKMPPYSFLIPSFPPPRILSGLHAFILGVMGWNWARQTAGHLISLCSASLHHALFLGEEGYIKGEEKAF